ncbi:MAG: hypothetical protein K0S32_3116, partial [Bacteroidetes bacterium]|nr:hypothetical protein [Bacteroidota bacterium]
FNKFEKIFREFNIWYEFSVLPGFKNDSSEQRFDYTLVTKKNPYSFSTEVETENTSGDFTEFPISTIHVTKGVGLVSTFINKILWKTGDRGYGNGLSARTASLKFTSPQQEMISIDILNAAKSSVYKKFLKNNNYMHWISHPKMFTNHGLKKFDAFLNHANQSYQVEYNFKKMHIKSKTI